MSCERVALDLIWAQTQPARRHNLLSPSCSTTLTNLRLICLRQRGAGVEPENTRPLISPVQGVVAREVNH